MFANLGVGFWLGWLSTILALISTAGIFPDFLAGGAIELTLSKPISRLRLFLTKYATGLLFVALQVGAFSVASLIVIGIKTGTWDARILLAVPIVVAYFSYLFCVCALLGLITRSTVASLLLTLLFWFATWALHATEQGFLTYRVSTTLQVASAEKAIASLEEKIRTLEAAPAPGDDASNHAPPPRPTTGGLSAALRWAFLNPPKADGTLRTWREIRLDDARRDLKRERERLTLQKANEDWARGVHRPFMLAKTFLPKSTETKDLLERVLLSESEMEQLSSRTQGDGDIQFGEEQRGVSAKEFTKAMESERRSRSAWWIVGTSLGFEAVVLAYCCWIFVRRDF
jgi:hypothetical protein